MTSVTDDLRLAADFAPATYDDWRKLVDGVLKGAPFEKLVGKTYDGLKIEPIYPRARGAAPIAGPARGSALADHAADRSSGCRGGQCAGAARPRKRRQRADPGVCRRQRRPWLRARRHRRKRSRRFWTASSSTPASGSSFRSVRSRGWPRSTSPNTSSAGASIPPPAISASVSIRSAPARCWGSSRYSWAEIVPAVHRRDQRPRRHGLQGSVRGRRRPGDPRRRRIGSAGTGLRAGGRRRLSARDRERRYCAGRRARHDLCAACRRCRSVPDHGKIPRAAAVVGADRTEPAALRQNRCSSPPRPHGGC